MIKVLYRIYLALTNDDMASIANVVHTLTAMSKTINDLEQYSVRLTMIAARVQTRYLQLRAEDEASHERLN